MSQFATYPSLRGKTVLITGAAEGIGASAVELFCRQGSHVIFLDINEASAQQLIEKITSISSVEQEGAGATTTTATTTTTTIPKFLHCDVADLDRLKQCAEEAEAIAKGSGSGGIDVLVNNAGAAGKSSRVPTADVTPETWERDVNVNLRSQFFLTQAVAPGMRRRGTGGSIVNLGSITWRIPATDSPVYTTCKAATLGMTRLHSKEFGVDGVRVNSIMPGAIATQRQIDEVLTDEYRATVFAAQSLKRDLKPEEVARLILFLAADDSSGITGSSYVVDGGWVSDP